MTVAPTHQDQDSAPAAAPPSAPGRRGLSRPAAFAAIAAIFVLFMAASSAPSPLYVVYQHQWGFSATTLTTVFAVYVVGMIGSLLVLGALSDHIGRRPVLVSAIALEAVAMVLFIAAGDVPLLLLARFVQGIATGAAMTTLGATLVDLNPPHAPHRAGVISGAAPTFGLGLGALGCGFLVQYGPHPTRLVYVLLLAGLVVAGLVIAALPETSALRPGAVRSLQPRLGVAPRLRADLVALVPILVASWALAGLYLALGPSVAAGLFGLSSHVVGGLVVTLLSVPASITAFALRGWPTERTLALGAALLVAGTAVGLAGVEAESVTAAALGTALAGVGFGAAGLASFGTLARIAEPAERGELFAVVFVISYLALSVPAVVAGFATTDVGLHRTAVVYSIAVIAFGALALVAQRLRTARAS
ncbi:MFS transporter [Actinacidiphila bryophytorum]|uniref:Predicted arabinose efflux permease, MFS family n=1 Tax=Actinacidiphila bryophytorum TaxID=1436133 RepID=A0A9W4H312_9ACTN|nr:MFS transporter [Actinacidiphila bryophytorum]MBM9437109.1 MFS transporter [Actinacidiphila bryophytorum]MBN6542044.1 MFS transporter [Actinacidiphila bryophytorum]CAG7646687.1 Predicted arabinose efflux permease, MFS family [Actinacidiphila bryophytorum]